jgi:hypothetical protein
MRACVLWLGLIGQNGYVDGNFYAMHNAGFNSLMPARS